jgi:hypothetical protein
MDDRLEMKTGVSRLNEMPRSFDPAAFLRIANFATS